MHVDSVADLAGTPTVVSVSDVHGHLDRLRSALLTLADYPFVEPMVEAGPDGLHWVGGEEFVLVINGDLVDRGPDSPGCLDLLGRLRADAPDGHVRYLVGNHDLALPQPFPDGWDRLYAATLDEDERRAFWERVLADEIAVAFEGHGYTYAHAGTPDAVDVAALNAGFRAVAEAMVDRVGSRDEAEALHRALAEHCPALQLPVFGRDDPRDLRQDPDSGVVWRDFSFLPPDAPPQVVGHTPHESVTRAGNVVCQDVISENVDSPGGETVLVETPDGLRALVRTPEGSVTVRSV